MLNIFRYEMLDPEVPKCKYQKYCASLNKALPTASSNSHANMENLSQLSWFIILPLYTNSMPWYSKLIQQLHHYRLHWLWELFHPLTEFIPSFPEINWHQANTRYLWNKLHDEESYQWELCWAIEHPETKQKKSNLTFCNNGTNLSLQIFLLLLTLFLNRLYFKFVYLMW